MRLHLFLFCVLFIQNITAMQPQEHELVPYYGQSSIPESSQSVSNLLAHTDTDDHNTDHVPPFLDDHTGTNRSSCSWLSSIKILQLWAKKNFLPYPIIGLYYPWGNLSM